MHFTESHALRGDYSVEFQRGGGRERENATPKQIFVFFPAGFMTTTKRGASFVVDSSNEERTSEIVESISVFLCSTI